MKAMTTAIAFLISSIFTAALATENSRESLNVDLQMQALEAQALSGNEKAQMKLARMYLHGQVKMAQMYLQGEGVEKDVEKGLAWYHLAAEQDLAFAQHKLARLYLDGDIVEQDVEQGLAWLERAADLGFIEAQLDLSLLLESGQYNPPDYVSAYKWLNIAASLSEIDIESRQDQLETKMTFLEKAQANYLYRACVLNNYTDC